MRARFYNSLIKPTVRVALGTLIFAQLLHADVTGTVLGTVTDTSGAVVPAAKVVLRNSLTGLTRETVTDAGGAYEFLAVPAGDGYGVEVESKGFRKSAEAGIKLLVNQRFRVDFKLQLGPVQEKVTVTAAPAQVETANTQIGDVIENSKMLGLPAH